MKGLSQFSSVSIHLASSDLIRSHSYGEVLKPETINYRTLRPERDGLFCERIFGPTKDYKCACGKYTSIRYKGVVCDRCKVTVTEASSRRYRTGHIDLAAPVAHIWYHRIVPSKLALLLGVAPSHIQSILYFEKYIVIDPGETDLEFYQVLSDDEYEEYQDRYKEAFTADTGAVAIKKILQSLDMDQLADTLRDLSYSKNKSDKKLTRRLEFVEELRKSGNKPEWMILDAVPVIPPDLRPMVPLDAGRFATSDINDLYRRLLNRNNRLKKLKKVNAPDIIIKNEMRMVQDAVDSLFDNTRRAHPVTGNGDRPLKSFSDILKGKQGRFRQNLLGKRVDYSGRSVIIVGPTLQLHQCGLPKRMALELFKPFVMHGLVHQNYAYNIKAAKRMIESEHELVWGILEEVVHDHPVLLNRAPTLHRLGIQAFEPILTEESAIQLHPLVCHAYNADFDGDQMAVHVPLSPESQIEAWLLMLSSRNLLNPANGKPIIYPTQDMVLGIYYLTKGAQEKPDKNKLKAFDTVSEILAAIDYQALDYHTWIRYRYQDAWIETTTGRVIFNEIVPEKLGFVNEVVTEKKAENLLAKCYKIYGVKETAYLADALKSLGYRYATLFGVTISLGDVEIPTEKADIVNKAAVEVQRIEENVRKGLVTLDEKYNQVIDLWASANEKLKRLVEKKLQTSRGGFNSLYIMMDSGARGSREQIRQLSGMRGLMAKPSGEIMEVPIRSNFKEGLSVLEYFISCHGARKGLADTALKTADAGYLTRKLVDVAQDIVVRMEDCGTVNGVWITAIHQGDEVLKSLSECLLGRTLAEDVYNPKTGDLLAEIGTILDEEQALAIEDAGLERVFIRSVLTCEATRGICMKCYGWDLSSRSPVSIGESVGIIAAQSIGQPGTQLTMRTFHIGGTAATSLEEDNFRLNYDAYVTDVPENVVVRANGEHVVTRKSYIKVRKVLRSIARKDLAEDALQRVQDEPSFSSEELLGHMRDGSELRFGRRGNVCVIEDEIVAVEGSYEYAVRAGSILDTKLAVGAVFTKGQPMLYFDPYNELYITEYSGVVGYAYDKDKGKDRQRSEILVCDEEGNDLERFPLLHGMTVVVEEKVEVQAGDIVARRPMGKRRTKDIIGGLPRVAELFESRKPKNAAVIAKVAGLVTEIEQKKGKFIVHVKARNQQVYQHQVPAGRNIYVRMGDRLQAGEELCDGMVSPHDVLSVLGPNALEQFLLDEIQSVYRLQGVDINEKHISVIVRQMLRKVEVMDAGDTEFIVGQSVSTVEFQRENLSTQKQGGQAAQASPVLMGLTKSSLFTDSFLSAAAFQETPRVLSSAALRGAVDPLLGLKENLLVGQLIPSGTNTERYVNLRLEDKLPT